MIATKNKGISFIANRYLLKQKSFEATIAKPVSEDLWVSIVIPCYDESNLSLTLDSIADCDKFNGVVEVIVVINHSIEESREIIEQNEKSLAVVREYEKKYYEGSLRFHCIKAFDMKPKAAGVGLARKIGMDEAVYRFSNINRDGLIVCLDGDCLVERNYLNVLTQYAQQNEYDVLHIKYEHQQDQNEILNEGIIAYECFLLYYELALKWCGYPYATQTVGSCICVKPSAYIKAGGMNKRKAGEDFYFMQKLMPFCNFKDIFETTVYPSARISNRVPFGTGKAQNKFISEINNTTKFKTYNFTAFQFINHFFKLLPILYNSIECKSLSSEIDIPDIIIEYVNKEILLSNILSIKKNVESFDKFTKRFFTSSWDAFNIMKLLHYCRDNRYPDEDIHTCLNRLNSVLKIGFKETDLLIEKLNAMRSFKAEH